MTPKILASLYPSDECKRAGSAVLALDLGTQCGFAVRTADGPIVSGSIDLNHSRWHGGGWRYLMFRDNLEMMHKAAGGFERILYEEVRRHLGVDAAHVYGGLMATLTAWAERLEIPYGSIPVGTWKRSLTGKGNSDKKAVLGAVRALGHAAASEDEADAIGVLLHALGTGAGTCSPAAFSERL